MYGEAPTTILGSVLEERHHAFLTHSDHQSGLVKDYLAGLDAEVKFLSLSLLFYFKVLERVGKEEYGNPAKGAMTDETMKSLIKKIGNELTNSEKKQAPSVLRCRHNKSEAHLIVEGAPTRDELQLCKKMARFFLERAIHTDK